MKQPAMTTREAFIWASSFLRENGNDDAESIAKWMLQQLLECDASGLFMAWEQRLEQDRLELLRHWLERKAAGEPVQYILGEQEFYGLSLAVNPAVLIPRPETELLVEAVIGTGQVMWPDGAPVMLDVGTGSGAIPISVFVHCPSWRLYAVDLSPDALSTAQQNAQRHGAKIHFMQGDLLQPAIDLGLKVDVLVSNPPYIPAGDLPRLQREVRDYEPHMALDGGGDGLGFYRRILQQVGHLQGIPRLIAFEVGFGQSREVERMLRQSGYWDVFRIISDLAGIERHVLGIKGK